MKPSLSGLLAALLFMSAISAQAEKVALIKVTGAINPATAVKAQCFILQLDTPGGLPDSTKDIVQSFYNAGVPVVVYVAASGENNTTTFLPLPMELSIPFLEGAALKGFPA